MATEDKISIAFAYDGENEDVPFSFETTEEALTRLGGEAGSSSSSAGGGGAGGGDGEGEGGGGTLFTPLTSGSWSSDSAFTLDPGSVLDCWYPELCAHVAAIVTAGTTALPLPLHVEGDDLSVALSFFCVDHNPAAFTFEGSDKVLRRVRHASWLKARGAVDEATEFIATKMDETTVGVNGFSVGPISFYYNRTSFAQDGIAATSNMHQLSGETLFLAFDGSSDDTRKKESKGKRAELVSNVQAMGYVAVWHYCHIHTEEINYGGGGGERAGKDIRWLKVSIPAKPVRGKKRGMGEISSASGMAQLL